MVKENFIYVGIDLHKETHTAVMIDCYNQKLGEITFPNRPAAFPKLVTKVKKCNTDAKEVVYGLENAYGYGRPLAVWLIDKGYFVKDVNTAISHRQAKHRGAMYRKSDSDDAEAIALATLNMLDKLPDDCPNDAYWSLGQLVHRRDNIMKQRTRLVNQLHEQLCIAYPSYKSFFNDISRPTALYFWEHYPSRKYLRGKSVEDLRKELVPVSHNRCSTKNCEKILDAVASDKVKNNAYQDARDMVTLSIVSDLQHYDSQLAEVDKMLEQMYKMLGCTLTTIPGVNVITAVKILAEIGDIKRFSNANKLAQFAGIAPLHLSSSGKGKDVATKQGNRRLQATIYFLAIQMVQVSSKGTPRNPVVRAYYEKRKAEGKTSQQALICISRRLISIIYGMLKNGTEYRMPVVENAGEKLQSKWQIYGRISSRCKGRRWRVYSFFDSGSSAWIIIRVKSLCQDQSGSKTHVPSVNTQVVRHPEIKSPNQVKTSDVTNYWDDYLGSNQTNIHPRTGLLDNNRIFSADGTKSIRFGNHEMDSMGTTKFHFHLEEWKYDPVNDVMDYFNTLVRIKEQVVK